MNDVDFANALVREARRMPLLRACPPEETLRAIEPALKHCGITRAASITGLDTLGIPVWISVRPGGKVLQVSCGKGLTDPAAKVSALMEACELHLAENPLPERLRQGSMTQLARAEPAAGIVAPAELPNFLDRHFAPDFPCEWTAGENMATGQRIFVPSSAIYFMRRPSFFDTGTNGLASGNNLAEAELHALYEIIERDAMCAMGERGVLKLSERGRVIDPDSVTFPLARSILDRCMARGHRVVLLALPAPVDVSAIWALLLSERSISTRTLVNPGFGAHADPKVALARALTEAAQSRVGKIQGAREDVLPRVGLPRNSKPWRVLNGLAPNTRWTEIEAAPRLDPPSAPEAAVELLVDELNRRGKSPVYRFDLSWPEWRLYCAKIVAPRLAFRKRLF